MTFDRNNLSGTELETLIFLARKVCAPASIRAVGSSRMLGDLQVKGLEPGKAVQLMGIKRREQFPPTGTEVILSILLGEQVVSSRSVLLEPFLFAEGDTMCPPILRVAWPEEAIQTHPRSEVRVAAPEFPSLEATLGFNGESFHARLLNLTETGMGLGLAQAMPIPLKSEVQVHTRLPGGEYIFAAGEVRHVEVVDHEPLPMRLGIVLTRMTDDMREVLHRFIQARRMDRSEELRRLGRME